MVGFSDMCLPFQLPHKCQEDTLLGGEAELQQGSRECPHGPPSAISIAIHDRKHLSCFLWPAKRTDCCQLNPHSKSATENYIGNPPRWISSLPYVKRAPAAESTSAGTMSRHQRTEKIIWDTVSRPP